MAKIKGFLTDLVYAGFLLASIYGVYQVYEPAAFIIGGVLGAWHFLPPRQKKAE